MSKRQRFITDVDHAADGIHAFVYDRTTNQQIGDNYTDEWQAQQAANLLNEAAKRAGKKIKLPCFGIVVKLGKLDLTRPGAFLGGKITSDLHEDDDGCVCGEEDFCNHCYNRVVDGIESMILAHASAGIDITSPAYIEGIETAVDAAGNHA